MFVPSPVPHIAVTVLDASPEKCKKNWHKPRGPLAGRLPRPLGWGRSIFSQYFEGSSQEVLVSSQHRRTSPSLFALTLAIVLPALLVEAIDAAEIQKPDKRSTGTTKAGSTDAERAHQLSRIFAAWRARQDRVKSFHCSWDSRVALPKGYAFPIYMDPPVVGGLHDERAEIGAESVEFTIPSSQLWVEGNDRIRDEYVELSFKGPRDWPQTARIRKLVDGMRVSRLEIPAAAGKSPQLVAWDQLSLKNQAAFQLAGLRRLDPQTFDFEPLCFAFRALAPALGWSPENCRIVGENVLVDGVRCVQIQMDTMDHSEMCSVDTNRDDVVVRWEIRRARSTPVSVAIEYRRDKDHGWIPSRWKRQLPGRNPNTNGSIESTITQCTINEKIPGDTFALSSPLDTRVCDVSAEGLISPDAGQSAVSAKESKLTAPSMDAIVAAWIKRREKAKSLKFTWHEEHVSPDGEKTEDTHTVLIDGNRFAYIADNNPYPPNIASVIIEREEDKSPNAQRRPAPSGFPPARIAFDGTMTRDYRALNHPTITGIGRTRPGFHIAEAQSQAIEPVLVMFRPFDANLGRVNADEYRVSPLRGKIGDIACVIIEKTEETMSPTRTVYWLDPARDYIVLRKQRFLGDRSHERMDISYRKDAAFGWIPEGSRESSISEVGYQCSSLSASITAFAINQPIPASEFLVDFPKGTKVHTPQGQTAGLRLALNVRAGSAQPRRAPVTSARRKPDGPSKPLFDPFADAVADVEAALKVAKGSQRKVLILFGNNARSESLRLFPILKEDAEVGPIVDKGFVLVLVDLYSVSGEKAIAKYFDAYRQIFEPHVGILDSNGENLQFQPTRWFIGEGVATYDPHRIKRLISFYLQPST
jgi:hypothetical protein